MALRMTGTEVDLEQPVSSRSWTRSPDLKAMREQMFEFVIDMLGAGLAREALPEDREVVRHARLHTPCWSSSIFEARISCMFKACNLLFYCYCIWF